MEENLGMLECAGKGKCLSIDKLHSPGSYHYNQTTTDDFAVRIYGLNNVWLLRLSLDKNSILNNQLVNR